MSFNLEKSDRREVPRRRTPDRRRKPTTNRRGPAPGRRSGDLREPTRKRAAGRASGPDSLVVEADEHAAKLERMRHLAYALDGVNEEAHRLCLKLTADARHAADVAMMRDRIRLPKL